MVEGDALQRRRELLVFLFLTVVLAPVLAVTIVGGYGFIVWMYQLLNGPPTG
jgi:nitrate reductase NapE